MKNGIVSITSQLANLITRMEETHVALKLARKLLSPNVQKLLAECSVGNGTGWDPDDEYDSPVVFVALVYEARELLHQEALKSFEPDLLMYLEKIDLFLWKHEGALEHMDWRVLCELSGHTWIPGLPRLWPMGPKSLSEGLLTHS